MKKPKPKFDWAQFETALRRVVDRVFDKAEKGECHNCGSTSLEFSGTRVSRTRKVRRVYCNDCGAWGTRAVA